MLDPYQLIKYLTVSEADFEIIKHENPILKTEDAVVYFGVSKIVPVFVIRTEKGFYALMIRSPKRKVDFKKLAKILNFRDFKLASEKEVLDAIQYQIGVIPLVGHDLPCFLDETITNLDFIYGGSGDKYSTLKIAVKDVVRLNKVISKIEIPYK